MTTFSEPNTLGLQHPPGLEITTLSLVLWQHVSLDPEETAHIFVALCDRVEQFHEMGHAIGCLNPDNVTLSYWNRNLRTVRIPAKDRNNRQADSGSFDQNLFSKERYLCPEQLKGNLVTASSDIFAIGAMIHCALTGAPPMPVSTKGRKPNPTLFREKKNSRPELRQALEQISRNCMEKNHDRRYATVAEIKLDINRALDGKALAEPRWQPTAKLECDRENETVSSTLRSLLSHKVVIATLAVNLLLWTAAWALGPGKNAFVRTSWNKPMHNYASGDLFSVKVSPNRDSYVYVFYVNDQDKVISLFPTRYQENFVPRNQVLEVKDVNSHRLMVDCKAGKLITVSLLRKDLKNNILRDTDWTEGLPEGHSLGFTGKELRERVKKLSGASAKLISYTEEQAPCAKAVENKSLNELSQ